MVHMIKFTFLNFSFAFPYKVPIKIFLRISKSLDYEGVRNLSCCHCCSFCPLLLVFRDYSRLSKSLSGKTTALPESHGYLGLYVSIR